MGDGFLTIRESQTSRFPFFRTLKEIFSFSLCPRRGDSPCLNVLGSLRQEVRGNLPIGTPALATTDGRFSLISCCDAGDRK